MIGLSDIVFFAGFVMAALLLRANGEAHKRLMLLAYVCIVVAAVGRFPGVLPLGPPAFFLELFYDEPVPTVAGLRYVIA